MFIPIPVAILILGAICYLVLRNGRLQAVISLTETRDAFKIWKEMNQGVYTGLSSEGCRLLGAWLDALTDFELHFPTSDCSEERELIISLLNDFPPNSPKELFQERSMERSLLLS